MGQLLLYSASAGSGKTHSIAGQYILLLFSKKHAHRNILAVTFTNKACEEMKSRIVEEMYDITKSTSPNERIQAIKKHTNLSSSKISEISKDIFKDILHDYSFFSVSTIDSFFQKIVKNFTRETGIQYNYEIELDKEQIINKGVDDLMSLCETNSNLKNDIIALVEENINESVKWDFRRKLKSFIKTVLESDYRKYESEYNIFFSDLAKYNEFKNKLYIIEKEFIKNIEEFSSEMKNILLSNNLKYEDFSRGNTSIIHRLIQTKERISANKMDTHFNNIGDISKWIKKSDIDKEPLKSSTIKLMSLSEKLENYYIQNITEYNTARIIKKQLSFAKLIDKALKIIHQNLYETSKFLISEIPVFLSEIANQNSSSFIYEKTGTYYENYLIDEFQDTSKIQWNSFKPLLSESLSSGGEKQINIIVGDLKQSIYSWRGGDWRLLASDVEQEFKNFIKNINLVDNWRSGKTIVDFNNSFFDEASKILQQSVNNETPLELQEITGNLVRQSIYGNLKQNTKKDFDSLVQIDVFKDTKTLQDQIILNLIKNIEILQSKNYEPGDMMILVRSNKDGSLIAKEIIKYSQSKEAKPGVIYDVVSSEALFISTNKAIKLIISCFRYLDNKNDNLAFTEAAYSYYVFTKLKHDNEIVFNQLEFSEYLTRKLLKIKDNYNYSLLHELTELLILTLELNKIEENVPFLNSFRDLIHEYSQNNTPEIRGFIEYWDEKGKTQNIKIPEKQNAINIITVHKSKGLASDIIFVPFCNWSLYKSNNTIWVDTNKEPYNVLPVWPANFDLKLKESHFAKNYYLDKFRQTIEAFNMLYVAYTRAKKALFISGENKPSKVSIMSIVKKGIENITQVENSNWQIIDNEVKISYSQGSLSLTNKRNINTDYIKSYDVFIPNKQIVIKPFYEKDKQSYTDSNNILKGVIYHKIFENIIEFADIDKAIQKLKNASIICDDSVDEYRDNITNILKNKYIKSWFDGSYSVSNEIEIADVGGIIKRPDRIMENESEIIIVDYKFGDTEQSKYVKQTAQYSNLLRKMGYTNIKTYIWFVLNNYLLKVDEKSFTTQKIDLANEKVN